MARFQAGRPRGELNWLSLQDLKNLCHLADIDVIRESGEVLFPFRIPGLAWILNHVICSRH
jgi:hypothetical protein